MLNNENADHSKDDAVENIEVLPSTEPVNVPGIELPGQQPAKQPRNQHLRVNEPKNKQFTARCTETQFAIINKALNDNDCDDIVQLTLYAIKLFKNDCLTPFKS